MDNRVAIWGGIGAAALGPLFQQYAVIAVCAFWGALVALTQRPPPQDKAEARAFAFVFSCGSFGIFFAGAAVYFERMYAPGMNVDYLFAVSAFGLAAWAPKWQGWFTLIVERLLRART